MTLAENESLKKLLVQNGMSKGFVKRFIAGESLEDACSIAISLQEKNIRVALDLLGENVLTAEEADAATDTYIAMLDFLAKAALVDNYISVKLTALGLDQSQALATANLRLILQAAQEYGPAFVRVDMEGSAYTQQTLEIVRTLHKEFKNVGMVLQSYLYRTDDDVQQMIADGIPIRLVKGAYNEPAAIAYPKKEDVDAAYLRQMRELLLHGYHTAIASQDEAIIRDAKRFVREQRIPNDQFEFQMLLGIRRDLQEGLASEGYRIRVYVPFGKTWYPYFMRRLAERPSNIRFVLRNLLKP